MPRKLELVMQALYASEINCGVQSFWDGGWSAWLGLEHDTAAAREMNLRFDEIGDWLHDHAIAYYPASEYAKANG